MAELTFLIINEVSSLISLENVNRDNLKISRDPTFDRCLSDVDGLFGAHLFWDFVCIGKMSLADEEIQLHNTEVGWILTSETVGNSQSRKAICNTKLKVLPDHIETFRNIEERSSTRTLYPEEHACGIPYTIHTTRDSTGRTIARVAKNTTTETTLVEHIG
ncbi:uncharacterized protein LOC122572241 [Bombus pyrosoma]|uniref:uncharacterized protein LOC122572241 n=1 Tax=Bombus pyrosoma TaxID=396416 RepID=UPI001CB94BBD|nr:uncharacterized protein LOC122572241 [Bombus pyrosoma]